MLGNADAMFKRPATSCHAEQGSQLLLEVWKRLKCLWARTNQQAAGDPLWLGECARVNCLHVRGCAEPLTSGELTRYRGALALPKPASGLARFLMCWHSDAAGCTISWLLEPMWLAEENTGCSLGDGC